MGRKNFTNFFCRGLTGNKTEACELNVLAGISEDHRLLTGMTKRILRVNQVLKEELGKIISKEIELPENVFCTITRVETLPNLQQARVYVSVMPDNAFKKVAVELQRHIFHLQHFLNEKFVMRPVPKIIFIKEKKTGEAAKIEELLGKISKYDA